MVRERSRTRLVLRLSLSLLILAGITLFYRRVVTNVNSTTVALTFLMAILAIATRWGLFEAIASSIVAMLCFNFFFLPPVGTFTIADPQNWVALFAFLTTAIVASQLSASVKNRALEAMRRQQEVERLYELSRGLMLLNKQAFVVDEVADCIARVFGLPMVIVFDRARDRIHRSDPMDQSISDVRLRELAFERTSSHDYAMGSFLLPLHLGGESLGSLAISENGISESAVHAIGNLAAIALERARAEEAASRMEAARRHEEMKSTLLDALAHEFKSPLTAIKAAASSIMDDEPSPHKELATIIDEESDRLDSLVNETIWMARMEANDLQLEKSRHTVTELIGSAMEKLRTLLKDREIEITIPDNLPEVFADRELIGLTLRQLVTNAQKYSNPDSPITIHASALSGAVRITVKDCGPGIPQAEVQRVFEKYYRGRNNDRIPGTGMGLAIARDIVRAHGGEIGVSSTLGQGSEFFFTLPVVNSITGENA